MTSFNEIQFDDAAFEILFKKHFVSLCTHCQYKYGFEMEDAKEAVHNGFIKLWENRKRLSPDLSVDAYLYKVIANICLDIIKHEKIKQKHRMFVYQDSSTAQQIIPSDFRQLNSDIDRAICELPEQMRKIFELSRYEGLKYAEIAAALQISVKTVENQMSRALTKLRHKLSDYLLMAVILFFNP